MPKAKLLAFLIIAFLLVPLGAHAQTLALSADFNSNTVGEKPPKDLPGDPTGDEITFSTSGGSITVQSSFGAMTDQPLVMDRTRSGVFGSTLHLRPGLENCGSYTVRWTGMAAQDTDNVRVSLNANLGLLVRVTYAGSGSLKLNETVPISVGFQPNVPQTFEINVHFATKTVDLAIDGVPVPEAQDFGFYDTLFPTHLASVGFTMGGIENEEYIIDDVEVLAHDCEVTTRSTTWSTLKSQF